ncbi:MAG: hypothetical protein ISR58_04850 [Anaerolineales bacterium]|nr:hypothetical protein [Chloroflexota bacterium]MBL6980500.1 hypothetical protein [Anaerolineales bacterium]
MKKFNLKRALQASLAWVIQPKVLAFILIFILAFRIRSAELAQIPSRYLRPNPGWELSSIAISLFNGDGFANPYMITTGPTAHLPPIYPYLVGFIYRIYGLTPEGGLRSMQLMVVTGALMYALLPWLSEKLGLGVQPGIIGGVAGAMFVEWPGHGEYLAAIALGLILVAFLRRWDQQNYSRGSSLLLGIAIGVAFHVQPALLTVILGCLIFEIWWSRNAKKWALTGVVILGILAASIPWGWRNYVTFDSVFFIRSNFGLELRMGNHEEAAPTMEVMDEEGDEHRHPAAHIAEAMKLREVGEIAYMQGAKTEAYEWIQSNPVEFLRLTSLRVVNVWFGPPYNLKVALGVSALSILAILGFWRISALLTIPQRAALLIPLGTFPLVYYVVGYMPRYRIPIDWALYLLAGAAVWQVTIWVLEIFSRSKYLAGMKSAQQRIH